MSVRFQDTGISTSNPPTIATPSSSAKISLSSSLLALHPHIRNNEHITKIVTNSLQLFFSLQSKEKSLKKFDDAEFIPTSCRLTKVEIKGTNRVKDNPNFIKIQEDSKADLLAFKKTMTGHMKNAAILECELLRSEIMSKIMKFADLILKQQLQLVRD